MSKLGTRAGLAALTLSVAFAWAGDPAKIDRTIAKEPVYQSSDPRYCLLTFGREGKTRVWLVFDSVPNPLIPGMAKDYLYVDRNGNGDLAEDGEHVPATVLKRKVYSNITKAGFYEEPFLEFAIGEIKDSAGVIYKDVKVTVQWYVGRERPCMIYASVPDSGVQRTELQMLVFAARPQEAPVLRFGGPMTMRFALGMPHALPLTEEFNLQAEVGSIGSGPGSFVSMRTDEFAKKLHPLAEIEWPHREAGKAPIKMSVTLNQRC